MPNLLITSNFPHLPIIDLIRKIFLQKKSNSLSTCIYICMSEIAQKLNALHVWLRWNDRFLKFLSTICSHATFSFAWYQLQSDTINIYSMYECVKNILYYAIIICEGIFLFPFQINQAWKQIKIVYCHKSNHRCTNAQLQANIRISLYKYNIIYS